MLLKHFNGVDLRNMMTDGVNPFKGRLFMVFASILILSVSGTSFMFVQYAYVSVIKTSLGYDQTTLNLLSFFKDLGANFGFLSGLISNILPPWMVLLIGSFMNFLSYFMLWLAVTGRIGKPRIWQMCAYICLGANSQTLFIGGALYTSVRNFPECKSIVSGLLKACLGLTSGIMAQLDHGFYRGDSQYSLILLMAWLPAVVSFVFLPSFRFMKNVQQTREMRPILCKMIYVYFALAGSIMATIILQYVLRFKRIEYTGSACLVIILLFSPLVIVIRYESRILRIKKQSSNDVSQMMDTEVPVSCVELSPPTMIVESLPPGEDKFKPPARGEDHTILQAIFSVDMLILFITITCCFGGTLTAVDNIAQIGDSLRYPSRSITSIISLLSIWNYLGRLFAGFASEYCLTKYKMSRPLMLTCVNLFCCVGHLLIALAVPNSLHFSSAIIGFCYGAQWPLMDAIISEIFGLRYCSILCSFAAMASPIGSYILKVRVTGRLYDKEGLKQMKALGRTRKPWEELSCSGSECFRMAFIIILATALVGCMVSCILVVRTSKFYRSLASKKGERNASEDDDQHTNQI